MRFVVAALVLLLLVLQWRLWTGERGMRRVWQLDREIAEQTQRNEALQAGNRALEAEVRDLASGTEALEERARSDLGMIRRGETYFQIVSEPVLPSAATLGGPVMDLPSNGEGKSP